MSYQSSMSEPHMCEADLSEILISEEPYSMEDEVSNLTRNQNRWSERHLDAIDPWYIQHEESEELEEDSFEVGPRSFMQRCNLWGAGFLSLVPLVLGFFAANEIWHIPGMTDLRHSPKYQPWFLTLAVLAICHPLYAYARARYYPDHRCNVFRALYVIASFVNVLSFAISEIPSITFATSIYLLLIQTMIFEWYPSDDV